MKVAYFDCFSGISGDMCLSALVDAGVPFKELKDGLKGLGLKSYEIKHKRVKRSGLSATKIDVLVHKKKPHRTFSDISGIIKTSELPEKIKKGAIKVFRSLFQVEAKVHGMSLKDTHLHELSGTDCLIDIVGTLLCLNYLGIKEVTSSPLNLGRGTVSTEHGLLPVPAPATVEIIKGIPVYSSGIERELTTPTGAAIISNLSASFGPFPEMTVSQIGHGAGGHMLKEQPNILRVFIGDKKPLSNKSLKNGYISERLLTIETNIDDMNPQVYEHLIDKLLNEGALDVYLTPVVMKKGRPAIILSLLCYPDKKDSLLDIILKETTTLGVRFFETGRICLKRKIKEIPTEFGTVRYKVVHAGDIKKSVPEYEDCKRIAQKTGIPLMEVMRKLTQKTNLD